MIPCAKGLCVLFVLSSALFAGDESFTLMSCSLRDQTAVIKVGENILLAQVGESLDEATHLKLEKVLPHRVVFTRADPNAPRQLIRLWFDISNGVEGAQLRRVVAIPEQVPVQQHFTPARMIPIDEDGQEILTEIPKQKN